MAKNLEIPFLLDFSMTTALRVRIVGSRIRILSLPLRLKW